MYDTRQGRRQSRCRSFCLVLLPLDTTANDLCLQADGGAFIGKDKQLLEALERQLFRLDGMRAAGGQKLSAQVGLQQRHFACRSTSRYMPAAEL